MVENNKALDLRNRDTIFNNLQSENFDLLVIGGGITGAGIARDAALRGLQVALVEAQDFASGTSSRSTKLVHGGLRYLAQGDIKLVREAATERATLENLAPHLAQTRSFMLPVENKAAQLKFRTGLWAYEKLGNVADHDTHKVMSLKDVNSAEPALDTKGWHSAITYGECITEDARLTLANIRSAAAAGAQVINYCRVTGFIHHANKLTGLEVMDVLNDDGEEFNIKAKVIVNAAGPWVDKISKLDKQLHPEKLQLTKGVHIVVPNTVLPLNNPLIATARDKRTIFLIPKDEITYIGTTDTFVSKSEYWPKADSSDIEYLLDAANNASKASNIQAKDITSLWAGIRPLIAEKGKAPSEISRKDETWESANGLLSIAGGKLTAYRQMAERVIDLVEEKLGKKPSICKTAYEILPGGDIGPKTLDQNPVLASLNTIERNRLIRNYGSEALTLYKEAQNPEYLLEAEVEQSVLIEGAQKLEDYWLRRSGRSLFDLDAGMASLDIVAAKMGTLLDWSKDRVNLELEHCRSTHQTRMTWHEGSLKGSLTLKQ